VDCVYHLAALPSVAGSIVCPAESNEVNLGATVRLLEVCRESRNVKRVVFASSSAVYGDGPEAIKSEDLAPRPLSPYALQKLTCESYGKLFGQLFDLSVVSLRFFNVYGPRQSCDSPYSGVIARFCSACCFGQDPVVFGDGRQTRDFTYVDDVVSGLILAGRSKSELVSGKVFNIATGVSVSLLDLLGAIESAAGWQTAPVFKPARVGDILRSCADVSLAKDRLGFSAKTSLTSGMAETVRWYRSEASKRT
jgi:UDP-glucose 4-epimerase